MLILEVRAYQTMAFKLPSTVAVPAVLNEVVCKTHNKANTVLVADSGSIFHYCVGKDMAKIFQNIGRFWERWPSQFDASPTHCDDGAAKADCSQRQLEPPRRQCLYHDLFFPKLAPTAVLV